MTRKKKGFCRKMVFVEANRARGGSEKEPGGGGARFSRKTHEEDERDF